MRGSNGIFVKLNYKNVGELNSFIYDKTNGLDSNNDRYVMCAGKYNKDGWTIVFKAKNIDEAERLVEMNSKKRQKIIDSAIIANEKVNIPYFM